ncbi:terminase small subunit [Xanthobacter sp. DSM 24535]|uniref:terminase small subunit n=1 Tax=Roseixanthobacter psychrophilus TaxID=3119917 RepID=UPI00372BC600
MSLTDKQARFVDEYMVDLNATQAAIRAGYSAKTAADIGRQLLRKTPVAVAISEHQRAISERTGVTAERVIEELAKIGFANMMDYMRSSPQGDPYLDFSNLTREQAAALAEVTVEDFKDGRGDDARDVRRVKFKLHDKRAALVDLGKHLGLFKERIEHTGKDGGPIEVSQSRDAIEASIESKLARISASGGAE